MKVVKNKIPGWCESKPEVLHPIDLREAYELIWGSAKIKVIKYYPYRTGMVYGGTEYPRESMESLETSLYAEIGEKSFCNHACFDVSCDGKEFGVMFTDLKCRIGNKVVEKRW